MSQKREAIVQGSVMFVAGALLMVGVFYVCYDAPLALYKDSLVCSPTYIRLNS